MAVAGRLTAIAMGSGNCLDADMEKALALAPDAMLVACNHAARDWPGRIDHWVSMHPDLFPKWIGERAVAGHPLCEHYWYPKHRAVRCPVKDARPIQTWGGSSGLLAVQVALELGAERVMLAGIPINQTFCHKGDNRYWTEARQYRGTWERHAHLLNGRARSFSGWTAELLGVPDQAWIDG